MDELALGHFVTARAFILSHELGHLLYRHRARTSSESVHNEQEADRFAAVVMQRTPLPPHGILVFFLADAHWSSWTSDSQQTHPMSGERVRALADSLDDPDLASKMRKLGSLLDDPEVRNGFVATGKAGDLAALAPRRPGEMPRVTERTKTARGAALFHGPYRVEAVQFSDPRPFPMELVLERDGDTVRGRYSFGLGLGAVEGTVVDRRLYFEWTWGGNFGRGTLEARGGDGFSGTWGYRDARTGAGTWTGRRSP